VAICSGKDKKFATTTMTTTHATMTGLPIMFGNLSDKLYVNLCSNVFNCHSTVRLTQKGMPKHFGTKI
jgi:hypothetical protein